MDKKRLQEIEEYINEPEEAWWLPAAAEDLRNLLAEVKRLRGELADGVQYINALVDGMTAEQFNAMVDAGKVDGIRAWLELNGEMIDV